MLLILVVGLLIGTTTATTEDTKGVFDEILVPDSLLDNPIRFIDVSNLLLFLRFLHTVAIAIEIVLFNLRDCLVAFGDVDLLSSELLLLR